MMEETLPTEDMTPAEQSAARVAAVQEAADAAIKVDEPYATMCEEGEVRIAKVVSNTDGQAHWVDVWLLGADLNGDPSFRVVNPPLLARDPAGDVEVGGIPHTLDPLAALAQVIAQFGGATPTRKG